MVFILTIYHLVYCSQHNIQLNDALFYGIASVLVMLIVFLLLRIKKLSNQEDKVKNPYNTHQQDTALEEEIETSKSHRQEASKLNLRELQLLTFFPHGILLVSRDGLIHFANVAFSQNLQILETDIVGKNIIEFIPENKPRAAFLEFLDYLQQSKPKPFLLNTQLHNNQNIPIEFQLNWNYCCELSNETEAYIFTFTKVSELKKTELIQQENEDQLQLNLDLLHPQDVVLDDIDHHNLLDVRQMQELQDALSSANQVGSVIKDLKGNNLTSPSNASTLFNLLLADGEHIKKSDEIYLHSPQTKHPSCKIYRKGYFVFAVAPIIVGGKTVASWFIGQVIDKPLKESIIFELAEKAGVNFDILLDEFNRSPKISTRRFKYNVDLLWIMAKKISTLSYSNFKLAKDLQIKKITEEKLSILSNAIEFAPMSVSITDKNGVIEFVNPKFTEATGYMAKEVIGKTHSILKSGFHNIQFYTELWTKIKKGQEWKGELKNKRKDGSMIWEKTAISPVKDANGKITHFISVKEDITEFKKANEQLIWSQTNLASAQRIARMGSWEYDLQTENSWWSDEMYRIYSIDYFISANTGMQILEHLIHPEDRDFYTNLIAKAKNTHSYFSGEFRVIMPQGNVNFIHIEGNTAFDEEGRPLKIVGMHQDITELRKTEEIYQKSQETILNIFKSSPDSIIVTDLSGIIMDCNAATIEMHCFESKDDFLKKHLLSFVALTSFETIDQLLDEVLDGEIIKNQECIFTRSDKSIFYAELSASLMKDTKGKPMAIVIIIKDSSIRKEYEQRLKQAKEKAEESDKLKSAFLANVSHEIRTPMNAIVGFANLLSDKDLNPDHKADFIREINKSGNKLLKLIDDIIELSRIETGQFDVHIGKCKINKALNELFTTFSEYKEATNKESLELRIYKDEPFQDFTINTDGYWIKRIISYLLDNAFKFTEIGFIEFGYRIQYYDHKKYLEFYVQDSGIGIESGKLASIFDMFRKVTAERSDALYDGTGLGLAIAKHVVEHLGGQMWVKSELGKGSCFYFSIEEITD